MLTAADIAGQCPPRQEHDLMDASPDWEEVFPASADACGPLEDASLDMVAQWHSTPIAERAMWILHSFPKDEWLTDFALTQWAEAWADPVLWLRLKARIQDAYIKGADFEAAVLAWRQNHAEICAEWQRPVAPKAARQPAALLPSSAVPEGAPPLRCDAQGRPYPDAGNFFTIFSHYPPWKEALWWEEFSQRAMLDDEPLDDHTFTRAAAWCGDTLGMSVRSEEQLRRCMVAVAAENPYDSLYEFVDALEWDGTPRLDTWLQRYAGSPSTRSVTLAGISLCCAMVARALTPGCLQRLVVILEGPENIGKSLLCSILGAPWARTYSRGMESKDAQLILHGCWLMELPELDSYRRSEESTMKAFLTTTVDSYIPKYKMTPVEYPRRTVFVATVNPQGAYLKGQTGNTRYLPVPCTQVNAEEFRLVRDQLLAEAKALVLSGYKWWDVDQDEDIVKEREERREVSIFEGLVSRWLDNVGEHEHMDYVTMEEILKRALSISEPERWKDRALVTQIGQIVHRCGWHRKRIRQGKELLWVYCK